MWGVGIGGGDGCGEGTHVVNNDDDDAIPIKHSLTLAELIDVDKKPKPGKRPSKSIYINRGGNDNKTSTTTNTTTNTTTGPPVLSTQGPSTTTSIIAPATTPPTNNPNTNTNPSDNIRKERLEKPITARQEANLLRREEQRKRGKANNKRPDEMD